jgi:hypothetical protein
MPIELSWGKVNNLHGVNGKRRTWLRASSRSSPLPALKVVVICGRSIGSDAHVSHCSTTLRAEEYIHDSTKKSGRLS